jgi:3'-phosphoadenosine 5'-phosphosulfate sulfotransferase (PAPS reductase)/FAD synthetase
MVVDTFHLFPETMDFLKQLEEHYGFKADVFCAEGIPVNDKAAFDKRYGADLWKEDIEQYDKVGRLYGEREFWCPTKRRVRGAAAPPYGGRH